MLSANQTTLLRRIIDAGRPVPIREVAEWQVASAYPFGENAARNALKRMEDRELVVGSGQGSARSFTATRIGVSALAEVAGATPADEDPAPETAVRNYVVLERVELDAITDEEIDHLLNTVDALYVARATVEARNTEHALRQTAVAAYPDVDADPVLIPVAERMFQPATVQIRNRRTVSIA